MFVVSRVLLVLFAVAFLMQGCSAVRFGYGNADSLSRWWIDQYVDMGPEQDALVRERLARLHLWHRKTQLPDYVALARLGQQFVAGKPMAADTLALGNDIIRRVRTLAEQATPDVADLLLTLAPEQIERMAKRFDDKNADYARDHQLADGAAGQRKARSKRMVERAEYWLGDLNGEQKASLRKMIDAQATGSQFWFEERLRRQRDWLALVRQVQRERPARERVIAMLHNYTAKFDLPEDPARLGQAQALRRASAELTAAIVAMATPEQRSHARHKLGDLITDFSELAREGQGAVAGG